MPRLTSQSSMGVRMQPSVDWRTFLTIEERLAVRNKINNAYTGSCKTYEELLDTVVAIEEELLYISAPSRLDYFKSGLEFESRVGLKRKQLQGVEHWNMPRNRSGFFSVNPDGMVLRTG